jgi:hypothetical protein
MNNFRLTTNNLYNGDFIIDKEKIDHVFSLLTSYDNYGHLRTKAGTFKLISRHLIKVKDLTNQKTYFKSIK